MPKKTDSGPKDPGPWLTRELEIAAVPTKKKQCALCELWFSVDNLTGVASWKAVLEKKASFGDEHAKEKIANPMTSHSRLYSGVPLLLLHAAHRARGRARLPGLGPGVRREQYEPPDNLAGLLQAQDESSPHVKM